MDNIGEWGKTVQVKERLQNNPLYEEPSRDSLHGKWQERRIIGKDCPINGGVYLGGGEREAVVVDDKKQPELISVYNELVHRRKAKEQQGEPFKAGVLTDVFDLTRDSIPYSEAKVMYITAGLHPDEKVALASFIVNKGGVCRHQALLAAYLLEKLKADGYISGQVSIDRNYIPGKGGHSWVRYVNSAGVTFIIDPAQNFAGRLEEAGKNQWSYERPR